MEETQWRSDKDILEDIRYRLNMDENISEELDSINIIVENAVVSLGGTVSSLELKQDIEDEIENIPGVAEIINNLQIVKI